MDVNPLGILLAEASIALLLAPHLARTSLTYELPPLRLFVTDSLTQGDLLDIGSPATDLKLRSGTYEAGFDYVVANPPYGKFPTRQMSDQQRQRFAPTLYGHPNLYGLFLQLGVELLAENGRLVFINPRSFVGGLYFRNLRRYLTQHLDILGFDTFDKRTGLFSGVLQDVVILSGRRSRAQSQTVRLREFAGWPDQPPARELDAPVESVLLPETFDRAFCVTADPLAHRVLSRMAENSRPLASFGFKAITGTIVWNRLKPHIRDAASDDALPLIWGNGVRSFRFAGLGKRDGTGTHCALVPKTENIVTRGDALLVKRLTAPEERRRIVACRLPPELANSGGYYGENHINIVRAADESELPLDGVLGLLNSRLFDFAFRALNGNTQVSATELDQLPIPEDANLDQVAALARQLTELGTEDEELLAQLNRAVYELYSISADDIAVLSYSS
jgi:adenine-specific DNA-methyltransferase